MNEYYTVHELAELLKVEDMTVRRYIKTGKIKALKSPVSRFLLINKADVEFLFKEKI